MIYWFRAACPPPQKGGYGVNTTIFQYALEVERTRSITQAAENLLIAQPNLSKAIRETEEALGYTIFHRTPRGAFPTEKGVRFLDAARAIVQQLKRMEQIAGDGDGRVQRLSLSMPRGSYLSKALVQFAASLDQSLPIELNITETGSMATIANVHDGAFGLGIVRYRLEHERYFQDYIAEKSLRSELVWEFSCLALLSRRHPLAGKHPLEEADLAGSIEIVHGDETVPYLPAAHAAADAPAARRIFLYERANQFDLLCHVPGAFMKVSPVPRDIAERYGLVQRRCAFASGRCRDVLVYRHDHTLTSLDRRLIDRIFAVKNEVALCEYD